MASLASNELEFLLTVFTSVRLARKGITAGNIIADKGAFTKSLYPGWKVENATLFLRSFYWKIFGRKWNLMSLFLKPVLSKWEWFMKIKNRSSWTKFTSPKKVSLSLLFDFRVLVTNNVYYVLHWACEQFFVEFS